MDLGTEMGTKHSKRTTNDSQWFVEMYDYGVQEARKRLEFTSNDMRNLHDKTGKYFPSNWGLLGDVMRDLAKAGVIKSTGRTIRSPRASQRGRPLRVWKSLIYQGS